MRRGTRNRARRGLDGAHEAGFRRIEAGWVARANREYARLRLLSRKAAGMADAAARPVLLPATRILIASWPPYRLPE